MNVRKSHMSAPVVIEGDELVSTGETAFGYARAKRWAQSWVASEAPAPRLPSLSAFEELRCWCERNRLNTDPIPIGNSTMVATDGLTEIHRTRCGTFFNLINDDGFYVASWRLTEDAAKKETQELLKENKLWL